MTLLLNVLELFVFIINDVIKVFNFILVSITSTFQRSVFITAKPICSMQQITFMLKIMRLQA